MGFLTFLNNLMFWTGKSKLALFQAMTDSPEQIKHLIQVVYKGMRDSFTMLAYCPFESEVLETVWAKFYLFSSFMQGLCKQNFDPFKTFLGSYIPEFLQTESEHQGVSILEDMSRLTIKFLSYSGLGKNNQSEIVPSDQISFIPVLERLMRCQIDMLTGPCEENQIRVYSQGSTIWMNILSRVISDLDSEYCFVLDLLLDYLLSLLEGH